MSCGRGVCIGWGCRANTECRASILLTPSTTLLHTHTLPPAAGKLSIVKDAALRSKFEHAASRAELDALTDAFVDAIKRGRHVGWGGGWGSTGGCGGNAWGRAQQHADKPWR